MDDESLDWAFVFRLCVYFFGCAFGIIFGGGLAVMAISLIAKVVFYG